MSDDKFDPMTAPLAEVLDWLAERDGWRTHGALWYRDEWDDGREMQSDNPITIDRLSGMLPEGWKWAHVGQQIAGFDVPNGNWFARAEKSGANETFMDPTERGARARVVAAVLMRG